MKVFRRYKRLKLVRDMIAFLDLELGIGRGPVTGSKKSELLGRAQQQVARHKRQLSRKQQRISTLKQQLEQLEQLEKLEERMGGKENHKNIVITGLGRSGTTLTCHLLNKLPNTIALSEPISPGKFADHLPDQEAVCDGVEGFYRRQRRLALKKGVVISKHVGGVVPDNTKGMVGGVRSRIADKGKISIDKSIEPDFNLAIKDVGMFTALLPALAKRFPCYAIVRNPLAVWASARSIQPGKRGKGNNPPAIARYDPDTFGRLQETGDQVEWWLTQLHLSFERYLTVLPEGHVLRYEDLVESGGRSLEVIVPAARELDEPLQSKNFNPLYNQDEMLRLGERLLESEGAYWNFYTRESVEELLGRTA
jgi:hypothetical protein